MYTDNTDNIANIQDVQEFIRFLVEQKSLIFHPDSDFSEYISIDTDEPTFSEHEVSHYNKLMDDCFSVCESENSDIYELSETVLRDQLKL